MGSPHWYQFRVIAVNVVGKSQPSELSDLLTVTLQRNAITVPRFNSELPEYMHVVEDERVELRVAVMGTPPPEISWFKDGFEIFSSRRTKIVSDNDSSVLIFHQVALTDDGEIKCTATNKAGHVATRCKLVVEAPPKIRLPRNYEEGLIVEADEVLRLKVGIAGQPQPEIQWIHEGQVISPKDIRYEVATSDKNSAIKINNVKRQDRGEYTVRASNKLGDDVASFLVTVTAKPEAPGKVKLKMSVGKSATLTWTPPPDDGGCKIGNYIVEYYRIGWNVWLKASTTRQLTTTLNDLIEGSEYKFRVKAENPYGVSEPSVESDILVIPDSKKSNPTIEEPPVPPKRRLFRL
uniref:Titin n=1 Tax=Megaselia scalaris TaxID=36166 RepID=T1H2B8_MEGSC